MTNNIFTTSNFRSAAATPFTTVAAASFVVAEATTKVAKKVAGKEAWGKTPFHKYVDAHATGVVFSFDFDADLKKVEEKKEEKADHSDMVEWKKGKWVSSAKAMEQAKKAGHEKAFVPQIYKAANWLIRISKEGGDKVFTSSNGNSHSYLGWAFHYTFEHAKYMFDKKGVKNAKTPEKLKEYFELACKHSKVDAAKLPSWEEVCAAAQAEQKLAEEEAAEERISVEEGREILAEVEVEEQPVEVETGKKAEARDGRAPKTTPAAKYDIKALVRKAGALHLKADNAYEVAEKAKAAFEAKKLTDDEFRFVVNACLAKDGGDPEEFYALMGEN